MVVNVLRKMKDMNNSLTVQEQYPGTYLLMVHPEEHVCTEVVWGIIW